jgi:hypothetical protein
MVPDDALASMGRDRMLYQGIDEPRAEYTERLRLWLDAHRTRGNPIALCEQLATYCQAAVRLTTVDRRGNWFVRQRDGTYDITLDTGNWDWDGLPLSPDWSRFWVIIHPTVAGEPWSLTSDAYGSFEFGDGTLWGTMTMTREHCARIRAIVRDWKPAGPKCVCVIIAFDDLSFDPLAPEPDGLWGQWYKGDPAVRARLDTARYLTGV